MVKLFLSFGPIILIYIFLSRIDYNLKLISLTLSIIFFIIYFIETFSFPLKVYSSEIEAKVIGRGNTRAFFFIAVIAISILVSYFMKT